MLGVVDIDPKGRLEASTNVVVVIVVNAHEINSSNSIALPHTIDALLGEKQGRLDLIQSTADLQLPVNQKKTTVKLDKIIDNTILDSMPKNIGNLKVEGTIYIPLIFVSLVLRKMKGYDCSYAVELTKEINEHITIETDRPKIASNNMSRELRKEDFKNLGWLNHHKNGKKPLFSLKSGWEEYWESYFGDKAPDI